jgi:Delta3-Delta2-enoyl-CoA isomerase
VAQSHTYIVGIMGADASPPSLPEGVTIERREAVVLVRMEREENRFHPDLLSALEGLLDEIEGGEEPAALVLTGAGKFFSNGLDLEYMAANPTEAESVLARVEALFARLLGLEVPTVAAVNGHAFAGGAMLTLSCDLAVMREDRGYFCLPEADLGLPFTPGMYTFLKARLGPPVAHRAMVTAHRFTAAEALAGGVVTEVAPEDEVVERAVALAAGLSGKPRHSYGAIKRDIYADAIAALSARRDGLE